MTKRVVQDKAPKGEGQSHAVFSWRAQVDEEDRLIQHLDFFTFTEPISDVNVWAALAIVSPTPTSGRRS